MLESKAAIRVVIVDEQPVVRLGLEHLLDSDPTLIVEGGAADLDELDGLLENVHPDVLVVDPGSDGAGALQPLRLTAKKLAGCKIIIYTASAERSQVMAALEMGVSGYLLKEGSLDEVLLGIHRVCEGCAVLAPAVANQLVEYLSQQGRPQQRDTQRALTDRELEVLTGLAQGGSNRAIAQSLYICEATVKFHVHAILAKLNAANRTEAVLIAAREGLIELGAYVPHKAD